MDLNNLKMKNHPPFPNNNRGNKQRFLFDTYEPRSLHHHQGKTQLGILGNTSSCFCWQTCAIQATWWKWNCIRHVIAFRGENTEDLTASSHLQFGTIYFTSDEIQRWRWTATSKGNENYPGNLFPIITSTWDVVQNITNRIVWPENYLPYFYYLYLPYLVNSILILWISNSQRRVRQSVAYVGRYT